MVPVFRRSNQLFHSLQSGFSRKIFFTSHLGQRFCEIWQVGTVSRCAAMVHGSLRPVHLVTTRVCLEHRSTWASLIVGSIGEVLK